MKITIKTTQQKVYQIDAETADTVGTLKQKIEEAHGHPVASQKIIYSGRILPDDKTIESCGIKEKDFFVLMASKPKATPAPAASTSSTPAPATPAPATPDAVPSTPAAVPSTPAPAPAPAPEPAAPAAVPSEPAVSSPAPGGLETGSFLSGNAYQEAVNNLVEMGFPREEVVRAMRASFNNPDRAVDYLMNGIPGNLEQEDSGPAAPPAAPVAAPATAPQTANTQAANPPPATGNQPQNLFQLAQQQQQQQQHGGAGLGGPGLAGAGGLNLDALRNSPQIQQLRQQIQENPEQAQLLLQQLAVQNPGIAQIFAQDPSLLANLLGVEFADEQGNPPPGATFVNVTPEERAAIERLESLGFPRHAVIEAYLACDKNEELAANYLFESFEGED